MTKLAKIISLVLTVAMILGVASAMIISTSAATAPSLSLTRVSEKNGELVVNINLTSGSFNSMDINFVMEGLTCTSISQGTAAVGGALFGNPSAGAGFSHISMASTDGFKTTGTLATATFKITDAKNYSFSIKVSSCSVSSKNEDGTLKNESVNPSISGNSIEPTTTTTTTKKTTTTTTTKKTTTTTTTKKSTTTTTTKKGETTTTTTTKKGETTTTTTAPDSIIPTATLPADLTTPDVTSSTSEDVSTDTNLDFDNFDQTEDQYDYYGSTDNTQAVDGETNELLDKSLDTKTIIIIAAIIVVLVAGAVVAFVFINKKKNAE